MISLRAEATAIIRTVRWEATEVLSGLPQRRLRKRLSIAGWNHKIRRAEAYDDLRLQMQINKYDHRYYCDRCREQIVYPHEFHRCDLDDPCKVSVTSSRSCDYGTRSCVLPHGPDFKAKRANYNNG